MQGQQVSHYRLTEKLGAGTYGEVWKGVHVHDAQLFVAIKLVHAALATDDAFLTALKAECRVLSRLHHPNIVGFRDLALGDSHPPAMVLELVPGGSLEDRLAAGPQPVDAVVSILDAMLAGLGHAHNKGVVHRDIKPGNVLLDSDGAVRLVDFGIARAADSGQATKTGVVQGTLDYLAPEVFNGSKAGPAADVYAAGLVAWELLTGRRACPEGALGTKLGWHIGMGLPDVRAERPDCPTWLAEVVAMLGSKDLASRPVDGAAALALLRTQSGAGQPTPSLPAPAPVAPGTVELSTEQVAASLPPQASSIGPRTVSLRSGEHLPPSTPPFGPTSVLAPDSLRSVKASPERPKPPTRSVESPKILVAVATATVALLLGVGGWFAFEEPDRTDRPPVSDSKSIEAPSARSGGTVEVGQSSRGTGTARMRVQPAGRYLVRITQVTGDYEESWDSSKVLELVGLPAGKYRTKASPRDGIGSSVRSTFEVTGNLNCRYTFDETTTEWDRDDCRPVASDDPPSKNTAMDESPFDVQFDNSNYYKYPEAIIQCGDGQSKRFGRSTRMVFDKPTSCRVTVDENQAAVQLERSVTIVCVEHDDQFDCYET